MIQAGARFAPEKTVLFTHLDERFVQESFTISYGLILVGLKEGEIISAILS